MKNFERLSNKVLSRRCPCGIVFETYDLKKVYHSNSCRVSCVRKRNGIRIAQRKRTKANKRVASIK